MRVTVLHKINRLQLLSISNDPMIRSGLLIHTCKNNVLDELIYGQILQYAKGRHA